MKTTKKFVAGRNLSFVSSNENGELEVVTLNPGDTLIVQPESFDVTDMPADADVLEVAPEAAPVAPELEPEVLPEAVPALASARPAVARRPLRPAVASAAVGSIRQKVQDFRASAMQGSALNKK